MSDDPELVSVSVDPVAERFVIERVENQCPHHKSGALKLP